MADKPRPAYGRNSRRQQDYHQSKVLRGYLAGGGTIADFARIHRLSVSAVERLTAGR